MIIPVGLDDENREKTPRVSYTIIAVNVLVFVFLWLEGTPGRVFGFVPAHRDPVQLVTHLFVHAGLLHLLGNMIIFYVTGPFVEDAYGRVPFALLYLSSGVFAALVDASHDPASLVPRVGASGAIAGVMGAFLVRFARRKIRFLWMPLFPLTWLSREFRVPAFVYLPFWFLLQYGVARVSGDTTGVAAWAHVGGFGFGFVTALVVAVTGIERRFNPRSIGAARPNPDLVRAIKEGRLGNLAEARRAAERVLAADPKSVDARRYAYELAVESGNREEIAECSNRLLDLYASLGEKDLARGLIRQVGERGFSSAGSRFLLRAGQFLEENGESARALELYDALLRKYPEHPRALRALVSVARLRQRKGDSAGAQDAIERARLHPSYDEQWRGILEGKDDGPSLVQASVAQRSPSGKPAAVKLQESVRERRDAGPSRAAGGWRTKLGRFLRWLLIAPVALASYTLPIVLLYAYVDATSRDHFSLSSRVLLSSCLMLSALAAVYLGARVAPAHNGRVAAALAVVLIVFLASQETPRALRDGIRGAGVRRVAALDGPQVFAAAAAVRHFRRRPARGLAAAQRGIAS